MYVYNLGDEKINICAQDLAAKMYEACEDMDARDYDETKEKTINELADALYWIEAAANNEYNKDYWRTFYNTIIFLYGLN